MQLDDILNGAAGGGAAETLARRFHIDPKTASSALDAILPQLTHRMERNTLSRGGLADLVELLPGATRYLDPEKVATPDLVSGGNEILETIRGSRDQSRKVAARAARETGLGESLLKQLLPAIAAMAVGGLSKGAGSGLDDLLKQIGLDPGAESVPSPTPAGDRTAPRPRPPLSGSPLPIPGDDLPGLGRGRASPSSRSPLDDLSDILRRGGRGGSTFEWPDQSGRGRGSERPGGARGRQVNLPSGSGGLWGIIRSILGSVLGFESKGLLGWLVRLIVLRWGVGFLRRILSRIFGGR